MYHDKVQAQRAAAASCAERGVQLWVYRCEYCGTWHLTHRDPQMDLAYGSNAYDPRKSGQGQRKPRSRRRGFKPRRK